MEAMPEKVGTVPRQFGGSVGFIQVSKRSLETVLKTCPQTAIFNPRWSQTYALSTKSFTSHSHIELQKEMSILDFFFKKSILAHVSASVPVLDKSLGLLRHWAPQLFPLCKLQDGINFISFSQ